MACSLICKTALQTCMTCSKQRFALHAWPTFTQATRRPALPPTSRRACSGGAVPTKQLRTCPADLREQAGILPFVRPTRNLCVRCFNALPRSARAEDSPSKKQRTTSRFTGYSGKASAQDYRYISYCRQTRASGVPAHFRQPLATLHKI